MHNLVDKLLAVNLKFNRGDRFRHKRSRHEGEILNIVVKDTPNNDVEIVYEILWDHFSQQCEYLAVEADDEWEKIINLVYGQANDLPTNNKYFQNIGDYEHKYETKPIDMRKNSTECVHEWAEYQGFSESFMYCKKCDKKSE